MISFLSKPDSSSSDAIKFMDSFGDLADRFDALSFSLNLLHADKVRPNDVFSSGAESVNLHERIQFLNKSFDWALSDFNKAKEFRFDRSLFDLLVITISDIEKSYKIVLNFAKSTKDDEELKSLLTTLLPQVYTFLNRLVIKTNQGMASRHQHRKPISISIEPPNA